MIRVAVVGASGYGGAELLRLLLSHPSVEVCQATSREPGRRVDALHPGLRGLTDLSLSASEPEALDPTLDAVFLALPHGASAGLMGAIIARCPQARIYDLAQDFRTGAEAEGWVYGQPEMFRAEIAASRRVACPGCFATSIALATLPAFAAGYVPSRVIADSKTGSSGSGATAKPLTHHPRRVGTLKAYKVFSHQHEREIKAAWQRCAEAATELPPLSFVPQSTPLVRGIYSCCYLLFEAPPEGIREAYVRRFEGSPFVRVLDAPPNVQDVRGTNNADLYVQQDGALVLVIASIDNLVRGAAGQAVQCMNIGFGIDEQAGLRLAALVP